MTPFETIRLAAGSLKIGDSTRFKCPWCHGGQSGEQSFVVTRRGLAAKYICHRSSCKGLSRGTLMISGNPTKLLASPLKKTKHRDYSAATYPVSIRVLSTLQGLYQLTPQAINFYGIKQAANNDVVLPTYSKGGLQHGVVVRLDNPIKTKVLIYPGNNSDGMSWFTGKPDYTLDKEYLTGVQLYSDFLDNTLVIVEDMYSAMKANYFMNSIALLGTNLNLEQATDIAGEDYHRILLALDADATARASTIATRLRAILPNMRVMVLSQDFKDTPYHVLGTILNENARRV